MKKISNHNVLFGEVESQIASWVVILVIFIFSVYVSLTLTSDHPTNLSREISFNVVKERVDVLTPEVAWSRLRADSKKITIFSTRLSEMPTWTYFETYPVNQIENTVIELPSRQTRAVECWTDGGEKSLGSADYHHKKGAISRVKSGFQIDLRDEKNSIAILCRISSIGPANLSIIQWPESQMDGSTLKFMRKSGLITGGLFVITLFALFTAIINRNTTYFLYAAWLTINMRMVSKAGGWDTQWMGFELPIEWMSQIRIITFALYITTSIILFTVVFKKESKQFSHIPILIAKYAFIPIIIAAFFPPYKYVILTLWILGTISYAFIIYHCIKIWYQKKSGLMTWWTIVVIITAMASMQDILSAIFGGIKIIESLNFVSSSVACSIAVGIAIARQIHLESLYKKQLQEELEQNYRAIPIGLFTLNPSGIFLRTNPAMRNILGEDVFQDSDISWADCFDNNSWNCLSEQVENETNSEIRVVRRGVNAANQQTFLVKATLYRGRIEGSLQDITSQTRATEDLIKMTNSDPLTNVHNWRGTENAVEAGMVELQLGKPLTIAHLDLEDFKHINEDYGHSVGDAVLKQVAARINATLGVDHSIGRVGSDTFVIVMPDTKIDLASWICRCIVNSVEGTPFIIGEKSFHVRCTIGVLEIGLGMEPREAFSGAVRACRSAREKGEKGILVQRM
jgi:diguanylate cyclase (GGDEF)-like protein